MQIERLRLVGFKSFADPVEVTIGPGLTGIVGPNGCGKSNLAEALRWVMGESSARRLRGGAIDDVIFAGSAGRAPRNLAEVALTIDNHARDAPFAFNDREEIEIVRRAERGGGSSWRLNGREVRARDVQLLFADAATGKGSGSFVSQGRVAELIELKPAERRFLLEEAAGDRIAACRRRAEPRPPRRCDCGSGRPIGGTAAPGEAGATLPPAGRTDPPPRGVTVLWAMAGRGGRGADPRRRTCRRRGGGENRRAGGGRRTAGQRQCRGGAAEFAAGGGRTRHRTAAADPGPRRARAGIGTNRGRTARHRAPAGRAWRRSRAGSSPAGRSRRRIGATFRRSRYPRHGRDGKRRT